MLRNRCETFLETNEQCTLVADHLGDHIFEDQTPLRGAKRPDAAPPKEIFLSAVGIARGEMWRIDRMQDSDVRYVLAPPPSDAAPVAGALAVALADGFRNMGNDGSGDDVSHPANWSLGAWVVYAMEVTKLYAHPEDAPGGPWLAERELSTNNWAVWFRGVTAHTIEFRGTKLQCIAVRDALNRLKGEGK